MKGKSFLKELLIYVISIGLNVLAYYAIINETQQVLGVIIVFCWLVNVLFGMILLDSYWTKTTGRLFRGCLIGMSAIVQCIYWLSVGNGMLSLSILFFLFPYVLFAAFVFVIAPLLGFINYLLND